jgi:hypothetical protein
VSHHPQEGTERFQELPSFSRDIQRLKDVPFLRSAFVVFSSNKQSEMAGHIDWLEEQWIKRQDFTTIPKRYTYAFNTISPWIDSAEFGSAYGR